MSNQIINDLLKKALSQRVCFKHPIAVVLESIDHRYVLGWNGAPEKIPHEECLRKGYASGEGMQRCPTVHAEIRGICNAVNEGVGLKGGTIYLNEWLSCDNCAKAIIEVGLERLVTPDDVYSDITRHILVPKLQNQPYNFELAEELFRKAGVEIVVDYSIKVNR